MFRFGSSKKPVPSSGERARLVGVDVNASRVRAVTAGDGRSRALHLDGDREELALFVALDRRSPAVGIAGVDLTRRAPHAVCSNFLPLLGRPQEWRGPRLTLNPTSATQAVLDKLQAPIHAESDAVGFALPPYLAASQVVTFQELSHIAKLPVRGTAAGPLAVAAHRAAFVLSPKAPPARRVYDEDERPNVLPLRVQEAISGAVLMIDVDEFALTASLIVVNSAEVSLQSTASWTQASSKAWNDRLIDAISDRCVKRCRRDPRDSADAEQALYEQLEDLKDQAHHGQTARLSVRAAHWFQDLQFPPEELDALCAPILAGSLECLRQFLQSSALPVPPRAVWLSHAVGRLPGLAAKIYKHCPEQTTVSILPANAVGEAVAALVPRWLVGTLPRGHLDGCIPLERAGTNGQTPLTSQPPSATIGKAGRKS
jgi:hypothetical protein